MYLCVSGGLQSPMDTAEHAHVHVCMYLCLCVHLLPLRTCVCRCMSVCACLYFCVCACVYMFVCICVYLCSYVHLCLCLCFCVHLCICVCVHTRAQPLPFQAPPWPCPLSFPVRLSVGPWGLVDGRQAAGPGGVRKE